MGFRFKEIDSKIKKAAKVFFLAARLSGIHLTAHSWTLADQAENSL
jgi:Ni,Fe-hydrogenase III large subunit